MMKLRSLPPHITLCVPLCILASALLLPAVSPGQGVASAARITARIDESRLVTLSGNTHPFANARHDLGKVADSLPMTDLILVLSRSAQQQAAFDAYVAGEYDQNSPNYHQWLTPDQIGDEFGPSQTDILTITNWLTGQGFTVSQVTRDRMSIRFSGTAGQVQSAFHTEIHNLMVKGQAHIGNMSDPQIPAALAPVVIGVKSLHNFFPRPAHHLGKTVQKVPSGGWLRPAASTAANAAAASSLRPTPNAAVNSAKTLPQFGISVSGTNGYLVEDVGPWDFATIYNVTPLWNAATPIDGSGQTIAIAGTSAIDLGEPSGSGAAGSGTAVGANGLDDVRTFRTFFDLPTGNSWNTPIQISGNGQPLTVCTNASLYCSLDDLIENSLDVEWSGSVAKNAQIVLVASYPASTSDDNLYDSESYIVDNIANPSSPVYGVHVMNVSYGACELAEGNSGNLEYYNLWQSAAAEGIAVFVAAGDSGSAACDDGGDGGGSNLPYAAEFGLSVSGLASTPFDTAVGGTDFNWCSLNTQFTAECTASPYWSSANSSTSQASANGYVPEVPWNDTCTSAATLSGQEWLWNSASAFDTTYQGSNGHTYSVTDAETACNEYVYWAQALSYSGDGGFLYFVDTVGGSGGRSNCVSNNTVNDLGTTTYTMGSVSSCGTATSIQNGSSTVPLTNDGWQKPSWQAGVAGIPSDGVRDIPDVSFFASAGFLSGSSYLVCVSAANGTGYFGYGGAQPCSYSTNVEPFAEEVGGTSVATPAMAGVMALINQKAGAAQGSPNKELYTLAAKQNYSSCSAESATTSNGCYFNDIDQGTNAMPCDYDIGYLYLGYSTTPSPNCTIAHAGDYVGILTDPVSGSAGFNAGTGYDLATGLGSLNVANVVNAWTAVTPGSAVPAVTVTPSPASINSNNTLSVTVTVAGATGAPQAPNGGGTIVPTGTVTLTANGTTYSSGAVALNSAGSATITIPANNLPGTTTGQVDTLTASYTGDVDYAAKSGTGTVTVTTTSVALLTPVISVTPASSTLNSSASLNVTVSVVPPSGSTILPIGSITLSASSGSYTATTQTIGTSPCTSAASCVFTISANSLGAGSVTLTAKYSGDSNYAAGQNTGSVTVTESTFTLTPGSPSSSSVTPGQSATVTVTAAAVAGYSGTVTLSCAQTNTTATGSDGTTCTGGGNSQINLSTCSGSSCSVTFTIGTYAPIVAALDRPRLPGGNKSPGGSGWLGAGSGAILALLVFLGIPARRRSWRNMLSVLVAIVALAALGAFTSCGGGNSGGSSGGGGGQSDPGTTAGTYTLTVTATANPSVTPTVTTTFQVVVN